MSGSMLRAENLHLWRSERHVLKGVDLTVRAGELLQLTGARTSGGRGNSGGEVPPCAMISRLIFNAQT